MVSRWTDLSVQPWQGFLVGYQTPTLVRIAAGALQAGYDYRFYVQATKGPGPRFASTFVDISVITTTQLGLAREAATGDWVS